MCCFPSRFVYNIPSALTVLRQRRMTLPGSECSSRTLEYFLHISSTAIIPSHLFFLYSVTWG